MIFEALEKQLTETPDITGRPQSRGVESTLKGDILDIMIARLQFENRQQRSLPLKSDVEMRGDIPCVVAHLLRVIYVL